jgi:hypothetical protein
MLFYFMYQDYKETRYDEDDETHITARGYMEALEKAEKYCARVSVWIMNEKTLRETMKLPELLRTRDGWMLFGLPIEIDNRMEDWQVWLR